MIRIDEGQIKSHLGEIVRDRAEETLNGLLDAEADKLRTAYITLIFDYNANLPVYNQI